MPPTATEAMFFNDLSTVGVLSDLDLMLVRSVSDTLPGQVRKLSVNALRNAIGGLPSIEDLPQGDVDPPVWRVEGNEGGWSIFIDSVVTDARYYMVYYFEPIKTQYITLAYIAESRSVASMGALEINIRAPYQDPPQRQFRIFKVQTITADYKGTMSTYKGDWAEIKLPKNWSPNAPTLDTDGYPVISYHPMPDGGFGYSVTFKINAPAGQKDYIKYYEVQRQTDGGVDPWPGDAEWSRLTDHPIEGYPAPGYIIYENTDRMFQPGWKYKYRVRAVALNGNKSAWSAEQQLTLTDDTTAPDAPVFTVKEGYLHFEIDFEPATQGGLQCKDWKYWRLQYNEGTGWNYIIGPPFGQLKESSYSFGIAGPDAATEVQFRAQAEDYAGNLSAWTDPSTGKTANKVDGDVIDSRTVNAGHVALKALTNTEIADLTLLTANFADLQITETKLGNSSISTPKLQALIVEGQHVKSLQIDTAHLKALVVTGDKVAVNTLALSKLTFTPLTSAGGTGEVILSINNTGEGIRIGGGKLAIDSFTTFTSDVEIQGILKSTGGIKTSTAGGRVEIGKFGGSDKVEIYDLSNVSTGKWDHSGLQIGGTGTRIKLFSSYMQIYGSSFLAFQLGSSSQGAVFSAYDESGSKILSINNLDNDKVIVNRNFDIASSKALQFSGTAALTGQVNGYGLNASGDPTDFSECVTKTDFNLLLTRLRAKSLLSTN